MNRYGPIECEATYEHKCTRPVAIRHTVIKFVLYYYLSPSSASLSGVVTTIITYCQSSTMFSAFIFVFEMQTNVNFSSVKMYAKQSDVHVAVVDRRV